MGGGVGHLMLSGPLLLAVPVAAAAGAVTFLSPCVLPLVPGYLSYVTGMSGVDAQRAGRPPGPAGRPVATAGVAPASAGAASSGAASSGAARRSTAGASAAGAQAAAATAALAGAATAAGGAVVPQGALPPPAGAVPRRTLAGAALFVLGFSLVFATEGVAFGGLGSLLRAHSAGLTQVLGAVTIVLGLMFAGAFDRFPITGRIVRPSVRPRAGLAGAPLLGALFGVGWTPCIGPTLSVVWTLAFASGTAARGAVLMFAYGLGLGIPFLAVALVLQRGMTALRFARRHARAITRAGGAMLVLVGVLELTGAWTAALNWLQVHWLASYQPPL
jgi:cytochrome c-type biogenesis protein